MNYCDMCFLVSAYLPGIDKRLVVCHSNNLIYDISQYIWVYAVVNSRIITHHLLCEISAGKLFFAG